MEQLFPVESPQQALPLETALEVADRLAVHVNHLNRAVKGGTGKPTSARVAGRITDEAKAPLQHTDWSVAEIACRRRARGPAVANGRLPNEVVELPVHPADAPGFPAVSFALAAALDRALAARIHRFQDRPFQAFPPGREVPELRFGYKFLRFCYLNLLPVPELCGAPKMIPVPGTATGSRAPLTPRASGNQ